MMKKKFICLCVAIVCTISLEVVALADEKVPYDRPVRSQPIISTLDSTINPEQNEQIIQK